jgi:hypothetical protein
MEMLLNVKTGVISVEGDVIGAEYKRVIVEEIEVEGGFKLVGENIEAFLSSEDYFNGKEFVVNTKEVKEIRIGQGNRIEMLNFVEEVKNDLVKGGFDLKVEMKQLQIEKYGELVYSNFYEVYLAGDETTIKEFLKTVQ